MVIRVVVLLAAMVVSTAVAGEYRYHGVRVDQLVDSMEDHRVIALTGDPEQDKYLFAVTYPQWLADSRDAAAEKTTTRNIHQDNLEERLAALYSDNPTSAYYHFYKRHAEEVHSEWTERALEIGFCKEPGKEDGHYFYCFGYGGNIYKVVDCVDYLDTDRGVIDRAWQYTFYREGEFKDYFQPGPYGIYPVPRITGMGFEPRVFID
jgi:hypothetical protein